MKRSLIYSKQFVFKSCVGLVLIGALVVFSCTKTSIPGHDFNNPAGYSADVIDKWMTLEIRLFNDAKGIGNGAFSRPFAYSGICAYESIDPGPDSWQGKYNGLAPLPQADKFKVYHWAASVNASLAEFNRSFFDTSKLNATDRSAIDSLEKALYASFNEKGPGSLGRSVLFGKAIATAIFDWSNSDSYKINNAIAYTLPVGPGLWQPTPPAHAAASGPYWGSDRRIVSSSGSNSTPAPPIPYSEDSSSAFFKMVNDLYQASKTLSPDQKNQALFWRDVPGVSTPGHWLSVTRQAIRQSNSHLDKAAKAFALVGISVNDAVIDVFKYKYVFNQLRPVTYIRKVMGDTSWLSFITTPAHPEYPAAHAVVSESAAEALTSVFGNIGPITDHTWDYIGFQPRTFNSFSEIADDACQSRFYGGIHYLPSLTAGIKEGKTVGKNIVSALHTSQKEK